jgi:hypothetical protein
MLRSALLGALALACACLSIAQASPMLERGASMYLPRAQEPTAGVGKPLRLMGALYVLTSYYGNGQGERLSRYTASGERFNPLGLTAAHRTLPIGTRILVALGDRQVIVRVNDRGPASYTGRSLDLSHGAARVLGMTGAGVARVRISVL